MNYKQRVFLSTAQTRAMRQTPMACCTCYNRVPEAVGELRKSRSPEEVCNILPFNRHTHGFSKVSRCLNAAQQLRGAWGYSVFLYGNGS